MSGKVAVYSCFLVALQFATLGSSSHHDIEGKWITEGGNSHIKIEPCGNKFCGKIVWMKKSDSGSEKFVGTQILKDFVVKDATTLEEGKILDPRSGKWYSAKLKNDGKNKLEVRAWLGLPALGKSVYWTR